jgi:penicillin-binding protein 2A
MATENGKKRTAIGALIAAAVIVTLACGLFYGNLDDTVQQEILSGIDREYNSRAPFSERVEIEKVPEHFVNALLLHEDRHFFEHRGINFKSILRASGVNLKALLSGRSPYQDGASTITQQLAKQLINNPQKTLKRKLKELKTTRVLETNFTKDEILEMYLNMVYFGNGAFGLKTASETYFGHVYDSLTVSESAMLVPFLTAPSKYNVIENPVVARKRQAVLLEKMKSTKNKS